MGYSSIPPSYLSHIFFRETIKMDNGNKSPDILKQKLDRFSAWQKKKGLLKKNHQLVGLKYCLSIELQIPYENGPVLDNIKGGIIADEMGLGKTMISFGLILCNIDVYRKTIVALPLALLSQWKHEIKKHLGSDAFIYHGPKRNSKESKMKREKAFITLTTYGILQLAKQDDWLFTQQFDRLIADEAHHTRNQNKLYKNMMKIKAKSKWMVTGTPIQNKIQDIISLCNLTNINPDPVKYKTNISPEFKKTILNHIIRRTKKGLNIDLPPLIKKTIKVKWESEEEKNIAENIHANMRFTKPTKQNVNRLIKFLGKGAIVWLIRMRQVCIFPKLLSKSFKQLEDEGFIDDILTLQRQNEIVQTKEELKEEAIKLSKSIFKSSSKINSVIRTILSQPRNERKIIFCHYREEINIIKTLLKKHNILTGIIDGRAKQKEREIITQRVISYKDFILINKGFYKLGQQFKGKNERTPKSLINPYNYITSYLSPEVMIIQIQTASEGLNLQHFNQVYFTSPWWNPALEDQAIARAHRIGQKSTVKVFHFIMEGFGKESITLDQYCMDIQKVKREIRL